MRSDGVCAGVGVRCDRFGQDGLMRVVNNGGTLDPLDDGLTCHRHWVRDCIRLVNMDRCGHLNGLDHVLDDIVRNVEGLVHWERLIHNVGLLGNLDNGGIVGHGSPQGSWNSDPEVRDLGLQDGGVVAGHVGSGGEVKLLGDLSWRLVDTDDGLALDLLGAVGSWHTHYWSWSHHRCNYRGNQVIHSIVGRCSPGEGKHGR